MTDNYAARFQSTLRMLLSETNNLYDLAQVSGMPVTEFYQGADLRGVDLRGQDLRGLNFDDADLRSANLELVTYDEGAFNNSWIDHGYIVVDHFDISFEDLHNLIVTRRNIWFLVEFRSSSLEQALGRTALPYYEVARRTGINEGTLRKARRGLPVTRVTAEAILRTVHEIIFSTESSPNRLYLFGDEERRSAWARQPSTRIVEASPDGGVKEVLSWYKELLIRNARKFGSVSWTF